MKKLYQTKLNYVPAIKTFLSLNRYLKFILYISKEKIYEYLCAINFILKLIIYKKRIHTFLSVLSPSWQISSE